VHGPGLLHGPSPGKGSTPGIGVAGSGLSVSGSTGTVVGGGATGTTAGVKRGNLINIIYFFSLLFFQN
jgi:hypothetical protein